jgi:hypothetical protein
MTYGATDDFGFKAIEARARARHPRDDPVLMGIDHD